MAHFTWAIFIQFYSNLIFSCIILHYHIICKLYVTSRRTLRTWFSRLSQKYILSLVFHFFSFRFVSLFFAHFSSYYFVPYRCSATFLPAPIHNIHVYYTIFVRSLASLSSSSSPSEFVVFFLFFFVVLLSIQKCFFFLLSVPFSSRSSSLHEEHYSSLQVIYNLKIHHIAFVCVSFLFQCKCADINLLFSFHSYTILCCYQVFVCVYGIWHGFRSYDTLL